MLYISYSKQYEDMLYLEQQIGIEKVGIDE